MDPKEAPEPLQNMKIENGTTYVELYREEEVGPIEDVGKHL